MAVKGLNFFSMLKTKMQWHEERQGLLSQNISNADTPNYKAKDLKPVDFKNYVEPVLSAGLGAARTDPQHISANIVADSGYGFEAERIRSFEITPEGNSVMLEEEMMKMTQNQMDYQTTATLYQKGMGLLKTALGRRG